MHDIKAIRENPESYDKAWARRGLSPQTPEILEIDGKLRDLITKRMNAQQSANTASNFISSEVYKLKNNNNNNEQPPMFA